MACGTARCSDPLLCAGRASGQVLSFIDAAIQAGCQHIIFVSMPVGDRVKFVPHYAVERHLEASGVAYTIIRPGYYMQNFLRKAPTHNVDIIKHHEIFLPVGTGKMAMLDAGDVGAVVVKIIEHPEVHKDKAYQLTGPQSLNFYQVAAAFSKELGVPIRYRKPGLLHFCWRLLRRGVKLPILLLMSVEYTVTRLHLGEGQTDTLAELLSRPATTLEEFVEKHRQHWLPQSVGR